MSVVLISGSLLKMYGAVKALDDCFILPGQGGDVVHNIAVDFLWNHAEHADVQHWKTHKKTPIHHRTEHLSVQFAYI